MNTELQECQQQLAFLTNRANKIHVLVNTFTSNHSSETRFNGNSLQCYCMFKYKPVETGSKLKVTVHLNGGTTGNDFRINTNVEMNILVSDGTTSQLLDGTRRVGATDNSKSQTICTTASLTGIWNAPNTNEITFTVQIRKLQGSLDAYLRYASIIIEEYHSFI